jgi:CheY-like chemotaxis protein
MEKEAPLTASTEFADQVRDVLNHLYDYAYLVHHPLKRWAAGMDEADPTLAVQKLRRTVLQAVEALRPPEMISDDDPAWRPYQVVYRRCVLGKSFDELAQTLGLGRRQIQRELRKGYEGVTQFLWDEWQETPHGEGPDQALYEEISRAATLRPGFDAKEQLTRALLPAFKMAEEYSVEIVTEVGAGAPMAAGSGMIFRQMVLSAFSHLVRSGLVTQVTVRIDATPEVVCSLIARLRANRQEVSPPDLPETLTALAASQNAQVIIQNDRESWTVRLVCPPAQRLIVVALVEDNKDLVALLSRYMASHGYRLVDVGASPDATQQIVALQPDVVVLDVMMPDVDGWEVLQQLRSHPELHDVPIVVCSILDEPHLAASLGADAYLHKPIGPVKFMECVAGLVKERLRRP